MKENNPCIRGAMGHVIDPMSGACRDCGKKIRPSVLERLEEAEKRIAQLEEDKHQGY